VTDNQAGGGTGRLVRDVVVYTLARLGLVAALTAAIFFVAQVIGGVAGAVAFPSLGYGTLFIPALFTGLAAAVYTVGQLRSRPRASD
jgi:predicted MFS family arabinose efflux permease